MAINLSKLGSSENAFGVVDSRYPVRWLDAWGDVDKAIVETYRAEDWTVTATGTAPVAASLVPDAKILISTQASTDFTGDNMQLLGSRFKLETNKPVYFGAKITCSEATQCDLLVGLCGVDTTLTAASSAHALAVSAGGAFFSKLDGVTAGYFKTYSTGTEANSAAAFTLDTSAHWYEMYWDGVSLTGYVDSVKVGCFTTTLTSEVLTPSICFRKGNTGATVYTCTVHDFITIAVRG
jgi:hypothetical protein